MTAIKTIYLAGVMDDPINGWRKGILGNNLELPIELLLEAAATRVYDNFQFPILPSAIFNNYDFVGPYFVNGFSKPGDRIFLEKANEFLTFEGFAKYFQTFYLNSMLKADLVFAWVNDTTTYQTFVEITLANAFNKRVVIASNTEIPELWPLYTLVDFGIKLDKNLTPRIALQQLLEVSVQTETYSEIIRNFSPIEKIFFDEWLNLNYKEVSFYDSRLALKPQHQVLGGKYRVDFAHLETKIAIELDGLEAHRTTDQIAHDRKRQREIEAEGWKFIRFGGKEIFNNPIACVIETRDFILKVLEK